MPPQKPLKTGPKNDPKKYHFLDQFWTNFGVHSGARNCSRRGPKMGPLLEPRPSGSQGSRPCVFRNYTRGVQRLLELELYSPKEREGYSLRKPPHSVGKQRQRKGKERQRKGFVGSLLEASWDNFAPSYPNLSHLGAILGAFWGQLGAILGFLGPS